MAKSKPTISKSKILLLSLLGLAILATGYLYTTRQKLDINEVREGSAPSLMSSSCGVVKSITLQSNCGGDSYLSASFTCGAKGKVDRQMDRSTCRSIGDWYANAAATCASRCPKFSPVPKPTVSPVPAGCSYQQVQCIKAPCPKILVCPDIGLEPEPVPSSIGGAKDIHGCLISGGYTWCQSKNTCLRSWETACPINYIGPPQKVN